MRINISLFFILNARRNWCISSRRISYFWYKAFDTAEIWYLAEECRCHSLWLSAYKVTLRIISDNKHSTWKSFSGINNKIVDRSSFRPELSVPAKPLMLTTAPRALCRWSRRIVSAISSTRDSMYNLSLRHSVDCRSFSAVSDHAARR